MYTAGKYFLPEQNSTFHDCNSSCWVIYCCKLLYQVPPFPTCCENDLDDSMIFHDVRLASLQLLILILLLGEPRNTPIPKVVAKHLPEAINFQLPHRTGVNPLVAAFSSLSFIGGVFDIFNQSVVNRTVTHIVGVVTLSNNPYKPSFATITGNRAIILTHHQQIINCRDHRRPVKVLQDLLFVYATAIEHVQLQLPKFSNLFMTENLQCTIDSYYFW